MEYTKGGWKADNGDSELWGVFEKDNGAEIAYLGEFNGEKFINIERTFDEYKGNAHLIAAAPDMYEALRAMADIHSPYSPRVAHDMADKALAKAEGKGE